MGPTHKPATARATGCLILIIALLAAAGGFYLGQQRHLATQQANSAPTPATGEQKTLWTCSMHPQVIQDKPGLCPICHMQLVPLSAASGDQERPGALTIDPAVVQNMGVRTVQARRGKVENDLRATGYLTQAQTKVHEVNLRVSGWIEKLYADYDGKYVDAGDPLFELYSPEIHQAAGELINATKAGEGHFANLGDVARRKLELWGLGKGQIDAIARLAAPPKTVTFYSPTSGHVLEKAVVEGAGVQAGMRLFNIVDHSELWLDVTIFERDLPYVSMGDPITAETEAHPGETISGEVIFIHPHIDMTTRAATVRLRLENPGLNYRPGMFATAHFRRQDVDEGILIPREAIIDTGSRTLVFLALDAGHFEPREIVVGGASADGEVAVTKGLAEGELVVASGQFLLDSESRLKEAVRKYLDKASGKAEAAPETPMTAMAPPAGTAVQSNPTVDAVYREYLALAEALGKDETDAPAIAVAPLHDAVGALAENPPDHSAHEKINALQDAVEKLSAEAPDNRREAFKAVSDGVIALAEALPPSKAVGEHVFVVYCSMADASWLQRTEEIANVYFSDSMKSCGEVKRDLQASGAAS